MRLMGTMFNDIQIIFHPLLSLTVDQIRTFLESCGRYGMVKVHSLDEVVGQNKSFWKHLTDCLLSIKNHNHDSLSYWFASGFLPCRMTFFVWLLS